MENEFISFFLLIKDFNHFLSPLLTLLKLYLSHNEEIPRVFYKSSDG